MKDYAAKYEQMKKTLSKSKGMDFRGKNYLTVATRHSVLMNAFPGETSIDSSIIEPLCKDGMVAVKVIIKVLNNTYSGLALEKIGSTFINKTSALENAETSALGRALAAMGLHGTEYSSADEVGNAVIQQKAIAKEEKDKKEKTKKEEPKVVAKQFADIHEFVTFFKKSIEQEAKNSKTENDFERKMQPYLKQYSDSLAAVKANSPQLHELTQQTYIENKEKINKGKE